MDSIKEALTLDVVAALDGVAAIKKVMRGKISLDEAESFPVTQLPAAGVEEGDFSSAYFYSSRGRDFFDKETTVNLELVLYVSDREDPETELNSLVADVCQALEADISRGGRAFRTEVRGGIRGGIDHLRAQAVYVSIVYKHGKQNPI